MYCYLWYIVGVGGGKIIKLTITQKIMLIAVSGVVASSITIFCISTFLMNGLLNRTMHDDMYAMQSVVSKMQALEEERLIHNVNIISSMQEFINAIYLQDAPKIKELAQFFRLQLGIDAIAITDTDGIVLARGHSERVGDDLSQRATWNAARKGEIKAGILYDENAVIPFTIRCDAPIYKDGSIVGIVSLALEICTEEYVDNMHNMTGMQFTLFRNDVRFMTSIKDNNGNRTVGSELDNNHIMEVVLGKGEIAIERTELFGEPFMATYWPIKSIDGEILGMWGVAKSLENQSREASSVLMVVILSSLGVMLLLVIAASLLGRKMTLPIRKANDYAVNVAGGNLDFPLDVQSQDEIGTLAGALQTMVSTLKERIQEINETNKLNEVQLAKLNLVVKASKIGLWDMEVTKDDPVNSANAFVFSDELRHMLGYESEKEIPNILGSWSGLLHPEDRDKTLDALTKHLLDRSGETPYDTEYRLLKKSGEYAYFLATGATIREKNGDAIRVAGALLDITEPKKLLLDLEHESSTLQTMFDSVADLIFCKDPDLNYSRCNKSLLQYFGINEEQLIGKDDESGLNIPKDLAKEYRAMDRVVMNENKSFTYEEYVPACDGSQRLFETNKVPLMLNGEAIGVMGIARDITERKAMEEATRCANQAKSAFLANMSHEIRSPLNVILGLTDLHMEMENIPEGLKADLKKINTSGSTLLNIVNDVLDISKIEAGKLELVPVQFDTASLLNDIITLNTIRIENKPITFNVEISEDLPCDIYGDELRLHQIFNNLLSNAFKYTHEGSVTMAVCSEKGEYDTLWVFITVSDTGIGIKPEDLEKLFSDFNQVDTKANRKIEGTGLGLSITKKMVELMDGEISVESEYGKGTTFRVRIKQTFVSDKPLGHEIVENLRTFHYMDIKQHISAKLVRDDMSYAKVLVVDDFQTNLDVAAGMMGKYKMQVDCVTSGQAAIDRIADGEPIYDAIFMDHMMPEMDGIEATMGIRAIGTDYAKTVPIISLTANAIAGNEKMFLDCGFQAFLSKPIDMVKLDVVLKKWVRDKTKEASIVTDTTTSESETAIQTIKVPGISMDRIRTIYGDDNELFLSILRSYVVSTPTVLDSLRYVTEKNLPDYAINVHGLKGASGNIGAEFVREKAAYMEAAAKAGDIAAVLAENDNLLREAQILVNDAKAWLDKLSTENEKPRLPGPDSALLTKLQQCCEEFNMSGADEVMELLESNQYDKDNDLIIRLREKIDTSDFDAVAESIGEYLEAAE